MGPFKHTVDDGLDLRKAAFECMYTLLDSCLDRIDIFTFLNHVEDGLKDHYDIKVRPHATTQILQHQGPFETVLILDWRLQKRRNTAAPATFYFILARLK